MPRTEVFFDEDKVSRRMSEEDAQCALGEIERCSECGEYSECECHL